MGGEKHLMSSTTLDVTCDIRLAKLENKIFVGEMNSADPLVQDCEDLTREVAKQTLAPNEILVRTNSIQISFQSLHLQRDILHRGQSNSIS